MLGLSKQEITRRFDEIVEFAELEDFIDAPVKTYSSGMYMRLGFAVAIHVDPDVLLIDEVLAVGDEAFTHKCLDKFAEFRRRDKTILLVTHSLNLVERFCDEALWLDEGRARAWAIRAASSSAYIIDVEKQEERHMAEADAQGQGRGDAARRSHSGRDRCPGRRRRSARSDRAPGEQRPRAAARHVPGRRGPLGIARGRNHRRRRWSGEDGQPAHVFYSGERVECA